MTRLSLSKLVLFYLFLVNPWHAASSAEESFLLIDGATEEIVFESGPHLHDRVTPCSTFKIFLSLIGFDAEVLKDENTPIWEYQEGYDDYLESWKAPQTPQSWMNRSCVWYSKILVSQLGSEKIEDYLASLDYGNRDLSGGLTTPAWISSTLKISPKEQVHFIRKMVHGNLPVASRAIQLTRLLLFKEELPDGWKLFGKTGMGTIKNPHVEDLQVGWFVGWIEKDQVFFPFAYSKRDCKIIPGQSILRVKELLSGL